MRAAHETLKSSLRLHAQRPTTGESTPVAAEARVVTGVPAERLRELNAELVQRARGLHRQPQARQDARAARGGARRRRHRLGPGRGARLREPCSSRASPSGSRARTRSAARSRTATSSSTTPRPAPSTRRSGTSPTPASFEVLQLAALRVRGARLRVRVLGRGAGGARALGGAVRRLRQRRADHHRPVPRLRLAEVAADLPADALAAARLRGERAGALEREARAVPPAGRPGEHPDRQRDDLGAVLPPPSPAGARSERAPARRHDPERAPAAEGGRFDPGRPRRGPVRARARRSGSRSRAGDEARRHLRQALLRHRRPRARAAGAVTSPSPGSSSSIRSPSRRRRRSSPRIPALEEVVWAQEEPQNMGAWRPIRHRLEEAVGGLPLRYVGRPWRASPSEGYPTSHARVQDRIVREVLEPLAVASGPRRCRRRCQRRSSDPRAVHARFAQDAGGGAAAEFAARCRTRSGRARSGPSFE